MAEGDSPKDGVGRSSMRSGRRSPLLDQKPPRPPSASSAMQKLKQGAGMSRTMKIAALVVMILCVLAVLRMWTSRQDAIAHKLSAPVGVQVITRSGPDAGTPVTAANLPKLEKQFRGPIAQFLSQQEVLQGMSASDLEKGLSASQRLVEENGRTVALFNWQVAPAKSQKGVFITLAYGSRDKQTHRILCLDSKPLDVSGGKCGDAIASAFHLRVK